MANKRQAAPALQHAMANSSRPDTGVTQDDEPIAALDPGKQLKLLLDFPRIHRALKREEGIDNTRHGFYDVLLAEVALQAQWEDNDIVALIWEGNAHGGRPKPNTAYCKLVIQEARLKTQTGNLDFAREAILMNLSDTWKLDIKSVIRHGTENALWHLQIEDGTEIQLGPSQDLMSQAKVRSKIFDVTGHMIPRYAPKDAHLWDHHLSLLALAAVTIDTPEMTRLGQARAYVNGYLEGLHFNPHHASEDWERQAKEHRPFIREGMLFLAARNLWLLHIRMSDPKMTQTELLDLLRLLGGRRITVALHTPDATSRSLWRIPLSALHTAHDETDGLTGLTPFNFGVAIND